MPVSSAIYSQLNQDTVKPLSPLEAQANAYKSQDLMVNSQIKQQGLMDDKAARQALIQSGGNQNKLLELYMQGGLGAQADALRKQMLDSETSRADIAQKGATTQKTLSEAEALKIGQHADILSQVQTPEQAMQWAKMGLDAGVLKPEQYEMALSNINKLQDPQSFEAWKQQAALGARKFIELNKPTYQERRLGGTSETLALPGLGGKPQVAYSAPITQSADSIATNARIASEGRLNRGQSQSQFDTRMQADKDAKAIEASQQATSSGSVLGVPAPAVMPWANQSNPRDANKVKASEQTRGAKEIEKDLDAAKKERETAAAAKRFLELNKRTNTGGLLDRVGVSRWAQGMGDDYSEMESITAKLAPAMREPGSGSTSDFDGKQFERATVGVDKPGTTNKNIANGVIARAQQAEDYADFRQTYLEQNGTLQGADRFWKDYANKNPIFDPSKEGTFELNKARKPWRDHFKTAKPAAPAFPATQGLTASEAAELADLRRRLGK